jgi:hypothetical protein
MLGARALPVRAERSRCGSRRWEPEVGARSAWGAGARRPGAGSLPGSLRLKAVKGGGRWEVGVGRLGVACLGGAVLRP